MRYWQKFRTVIDGSATVAEYIQPEIDEAPVIEQDPEWHGKHVRESQYLQTRARIWREIIP